jgi:hypothetical protein
MTADERATLAKVERLLAKERLERQLAQERLMLKHYDLPLLDEALALLRGLLAEPQVNPSEAKLPIPSRWDGGNEGDTWCVEIECDRFAIEYRDTTGGGS